MELRFHRTASLVCQKEEVESPTAHGELVSEEAKLQSFSVACQVPWDILKVIIQLWSHHLCSLNWHSPGTVVPCAMPE